MPKGEKVRSSSASGRLEASHVTSILSELGGSVKRTRKIVVSGDQAEEADSLLESQHLCVSEVKKTQPEWVVQELLKPNRRRHSVTLGEEHDVITPQRHGTVSSHNFEYSDFMNCLMDERISVDDLQRLKLAFEEFESSLRGIDERNFGHIMKKYLALPNMNNAQIHGLFKKIDYLGQGRISWGEFCTHVLQRYKSKEETVRRSKQVTFTLPATMSACGIPVVNIHPSHDGTVVTVQEDGFVCHWSPDLKPQRTKHMFNEGPANRKSKWVSDFTLMLEYNKLIIGTGSREIQFYDLSTLYPQCQISALDTIPLTLDCSCTGSDKCCILYGDAEGCVAIILISSVEYTFRTWRKSPKTENVPNITIDKAVLSPHVTFVRWKVHRDWVTQAKYFHSHQAVVSSSNEESSSLVIGCVLPSRDVAQQLKEITEASYDGKTRKVQLSWTPQARASCDQTVFTVNKGVKSFDLCQSLLATGGMDRLIRLWNPHFSGKPTGVLKGHSAPIFSLCISSEDCQIFSISTDGTVKIWHIQDQCCLHTADPRASGLHGDISACRYSPAMKSLYIAAESLLVLTLKLRPPLHSCSTESHNEPVMCCGYSAEFRQVVSCSEGSVVKVWDFDTGHQIFEFGGTQDLTGITCMTFDSTGRRLITGERDGSLKIWNFNSGQCLKTLKKNGKCRAVCDCIFLKVHANSYVMSVGGDRKIDIYADNPEGLHRVQGPQPSWQDDLINGHKEEILCVVQCPPSLLATSSFDGEIVVWNLLSGHMQCRFAAEHQNAEGLDMSVPSIIFLENSKTRQLSLTTALLSSGVKGCIDLWNVFGEGELVSSFKASNFNQKITKLAKTAKDTLVYAADRLGYVHVYNMEEFDLEVKSPRAEIFWRAHTDVITGLQIVDTNQVVLTSSADHAVRLWSAKGECIGTFGQREMWNVHIPSSWMHPRVPFEVLTDPLSMPDLDILNGKSHLPESINPDKSEADRGELKSYDETSNGSLT